MEGVLASNYEFGAPEGALLDCQSLETVLNREKAGSQTCVENQVASSELCGCPALPTDIVNSTTGVQANQTAETQVPVVAAAQCTLCSDGGPIAWPERNISIGELFPVRNCSDLDRFVGLLVDGSEDCDSVHLVSTYCGCMAAINDCLFCASGEPMLYPDKQLDWLNDYLYDVPEYFRSIPITCSLMEALLRNVPEDLFPSTNQMLCMSAQFKSGICGCKYNWRPKLLVWCYRISGFLSFTVSTGVLSNCALRSFSGF